MIDKKTLSKDKSDRSKEIWPILRQAQDFLHAYEVLKNYNHNRMKTGEQTVFCADIVQLMFAIELLFKALLCGDAKKVHNIEKLFTQLSPQVQEEIKERLLKRSGRARDIFSISFELQIKKYAGAFQDWRYFHEMGRGTFNSEFCENLAHVLNDIVQDQIGLDSSLLR